MLMIMACVFQSFLTAIMQQMARKNEWPLDRMVLQCDVTKKTREDMAGPPREGAYIHGVFMEGSEHFLQYTTFFITVQFLFL
jgi:dynein heavy chain